MILLLTGASAFAEVPGEYTQLERLNHRGIWDGRFTNASSGLGWEIPDAGSSEGKAGNKEDPRHFFIPTHKELKHLFDEVERDDISNVGKVRDYADEALVQFRHDMAIRGVRIPKGYYQAMLGDAYSGSRRVNLGYYDRPIPEDLQKQREEGELEAYSAVILKRQGKVVAAFPIDRREPYGRQKGERKAKRSFAAVEAGPGGPVLKIYLKKWIYAVDISETALPITYPPVTQASPDIPESAP